MGFDGKYRIVVTDIEISASHGDNARQAARIAIIGAGPAGLMAADVLARNGYRITVYDRMASPARKFLMAGRGGLNLTHSEPLEQFICRYGESKDRLGPLLYAFTPADLMSWANGLGADVFVGSSGRVFPKAMKASPLLRAWLRRLADLGVEFRLGHRWVGFGHDAHELLFENQSGATLHEHADACLVATGGASWPRLGSDGEALGILKKQGVAITPFRAHNAGVRVAWSDRLLSRCEGAPVKRVAVRVGTETRRGDVVVTRSGLEGGPVYALNTAIERSIVAHNASTQLQLDLRPDLSINELAARMARPRGRRSMANYLRQTAGLSPVAIALAREPGRGQLPTDPDVLAAHIKSVPIEISGLSGVARAISSAGGVSWDAIDKDGMLRKQPGVFVAGEVIDWVAPTGGYLLQATFAQGVQAAKGMSKWLKATSASSSPAHRRD